MKKIEFLIVVIFFLLSIPVNGQPEIKIIVEKLNFIEVNFPDNFSEEISEVKSLVNRFSKSLNGEILTEIDDKYNELVSELMGFKYFLNLDEDNDASFELLSLEELIELRSEKLLSSYLRNNAGRNKLNTLYNYYKSKRETPSGFWDPSNDINPLEIFDSEWVNTMVELDQEILIKREQEWELIPSHIKRIFDIGEDKEKLIVEQEKIRSDIKYIRSKVNMMDGEEAFAHELNPLKDRFNELENEIFIMAQEKEAILSSLSIREIPEIKRIENLFYDQVFNEIPKEVLLLN